jgi:hypothetical protein
MLCFREWCASYPSSYFCWTQPNSPDDFLQTFSLANHDRFCLNYLVTSHYFGPTRGIAWEGGICREWSNVKHAKTGIVSNLSINTGMVVIQVSESLMDVP